MLYTLAIGSIVKNSYLTETYGKVDVYCLKQVDAVLPMFLNFALEYIRKFQGNKRGLKLKGCISFWSVLLILIWTKTITGTPSTVKTYNLIDTKKEYFKIVYSVHFLDHCTKFISRTKCTILITYRYSEQVHSLMVNKIPALKPTANDKLLFTRLFSL